MAAEKKSIKIAMIILLIMLIYALAYSVIAFISPDIFVSRSFPVTGQSWSDLVASSPEVANFILGAWRLAAGFAFSVVIAGLFVLFTGFKKGEKWAWYFMLFVSLVAWANNLRSAISHENSLSIILTIVGLVLFVIGIVIPAKDFLGKQKT